METAVKVARIGNAILGFVAIIMILLMLSYGGYSLWDNYSINRNAFLSGDLLKYKPNPSTPEAENYSLEELLMINPDTRAWLTIDGTNIDYPVVQGEDDMDYINTDIYGEFSLSGSIFLTCLNSPDFSDRYNLVYGHHMDNGGMFGDVINFVDADYFESHQTGTLYLPNGTRSITLFACIETDGYDKYIYNPGPDFETQELLDYLKASSSQYRDISVTADDQIIGLSTCKDAVTNGRVILFGRLN